MKPLSLRIVLHLFAFGAAVALVVMLTACVDGEPYTPTEPQSTHVCDRTFGCRPDSASISITIPNPLYQPPDTT